MLHARNLWTPFLISALLAGTCWAQAKKSKDEQQKFYHLDFVVKEVADGKVINSRSYSTMISTGGNPLPAEIRAGNKVPIQTGPAGNRQPDYLDVGVNFDCRSAGEVESQLALNVTAEVSNLAPGQIPGSGPLPPLLRQNKWSSDVILPLRKPTVIFSSDDPTSTHKMQVELTATPIK
jgi:hypothetical protein